MSVQATFNEIQPELTYLGWNSNSHRKLFHTISSTRLWKGNFHFFWALKHFGGVKMIKKLTSLHILKRGLHISFTRSQSVRFLFRVCSCPVTPVSEGPVNQQCLDLLLEFELPLHAVSVLSRVPEDLTAPLTSPHPLCTAATLSFYLRKTVFCFVSSGIPHLIDTRTHT